MMFNPRLISHIAMKILRLLNSKRDNVRGFVVLVDKKERKEEVVRRIQRDMALPTLRRAIVVWLVCWLLFVVACCRFCGGWVKPGKTW